MKRILYMLIKNLIYLPRFITRLYRYTKNTENYTEEQRYELLKEIVEKANRGGNVKLEVTGQEHIPEKGFMLFPNHQGMYDMLAVIATCPHPVFIVAKKEVEKVPVLKQALACMNVFYMDREDVRQSMKVIMNVAKEVKQGKNYAIFPEGTRSKKGNVLGEFKAGSFKAATMAKCPIVPVAFINAFKPFDTNSIEPVTVQIHYLEPISYEEYKDMKTTEIAQEVNKRIEQKIEEQLGRK